MISETGYTVQGTGCKVQGTGGAEYNLPLIPYKYCSFIHWHSSRDSLSIIVDRHRFALLRRRGHRRGRRCRGWLHRGRGGSGGRGGGRGGGGRHGGCHGRRRGHGLGEGDDGGGRLAHFPLVLEPPGGREAEAEKRREKRRYTPRYRVVHGEEAAKRRRIVEMWCPVFLCRVHGEVRNAKYPQP